MKKRTKEDKAILKASKENMRGALSDAGKMILYNRQLKEQAMNKHSKLLNNK